MPFTSKINLADAVGEFVTPGVELVVEPLSRLRVITGFLLESELAENGQDAVERRFVDQSLIPHPTDGLAYPGGLKNPDGSAQGNDGGPILSTVAGDYRYTGADAAFLDNGIYNLGVRPIHEDLGRGGLDAFNWPLSLTTLMMKNLEGTGYNPGGDAPGPELIAGTGIKGFPQPAGLGNVMLRFDPDHDEGCFGLFEPNAQDWRINPGCNGELEAMQAKDLPMSFRLDDSMAMSPSLKLSNYQSVVVLARISKSGNATPASGDLVGSVGPVIPGGRDVKVLIDRVVP